jgi:hypothetical protein
MREFRISRGTGSPITLEEWVAALNKLEGVRLTGGNNPRAKHSGNAEVYSPKFAEWVEAFRWTKTGEAVFKSAAGDVVVRTAYQLARELRAGVIDKDGQPVAEASLM